MLSKNAGLVLGSLLSAGYANTEELMRRTGLGQPAISKATKELDTSPDAPDFVRITERQHLFAVKAKPLDIGVWRNIGGTKNARMGDLSALSGLRGGYLFTGNNGAMSISDSLPWFMQDMRPQGFLGRALAQRIASDLNFDPDIRRWSDNDALDALRHCRSDVIGDLSFAGAPIDGPAVVSDMDRAARYARLAAEAIAGVAYAGPIAFGEQAKFCTDAAIVKFSPPVASDVGVRWNDLLVCEHIAGQVLLEHGIAAVKSRLLPSRTAADRTFLEVQRFDRLAEGGRLAMASLATIDNEFIGSGRSWSVIMRAMPELFAQGDLDTVVTLEQFGGLIGNTDMHAGNLSFTYVDWNSPVFSLLPIYDMLPMAYAPVNGEVVPGLRPTPQRKVSEKAKKMGVAFWRAVACSPLVSTGFQALAAEHVILVEKVGILPDAPSLKSVPR